MLEIVCGEDFLFGAKDSFTCTLFWRTEEGDFPAEGWTDFAGVALKWWTDAYFCLVYSTVAEFLFMDGPYRIRAVREGKNVRLSFLRDDSQALPDQMIGMEEVRSALLRAARRLKSGLTAEGKKEKVLLTDGVIERLKRAE